jgi:tetratricopeptide (TPR) repeat protein
MSLSAVVVVGEVTDHLDACLASLHGLVDEVVAAGAPGSEGAVTAVAQRHGAVLVPESASGGAAPARNHALDLVAGEWVLQVEPDEEAEADVDAVRARLDHAPDDVAFRVRHVPRPGWTPTREPRLWRNRPDIRYEGRVRETVVPAVRSVAGAEGLRIDALDDLTIRRADEVGPGDPWTHDESELRAEIERAPDRSVVYDDLARLYDARGDAERAVATWMAGIARSRARAAPDPDDRLLYAAVIQHLLTRGAIDDDLARLVEEGRERFERTPMFELAAARVAYATGRPRDALEPLDWLVGLDDEAVVATGASCDERVVGEWAWSLLGVCHFALGDDADAVDAFREAERLAPDEPSYRARRRLAEARAASPDAEAS